MRGYIGSNYILVAGGFGYLLRFSIEDLGQGQKGEGKENGGFARA